eukprot:Sspe_Gene.31503::Locus_15535_Transcript_2_4_Confidence_0.286_Length_1872::g.31503::m.31503/K15528/FAAH; fatty acid amide hydrolase
MKMEDWQLYMGVGGAVYVAYYLQSYIRAKRRHDALHVNAKKKRAQRDAARRNMQSLNFEEVPNGVDIVGMSAIELLGAMEKGDLTSEEIVRAFCARAKQVGEELDTNAEELFADAIAEASQCDRERKAGKLRGPLHGLPISVKDQYHQRDTMSTCGMMARTFEKSSEDGELVAMLREAGAIPFVRTNVPQLLLLPESANRIWGTAKNPFDPTRTVGGSSGGEAGLIASRGSPLGLGTDIGGSIRIPCHFCGITGIKPTPQRITRRGVAVPRVGNASGQNAVVTGAGPMGNTVDDLDLVMQIWCGPSTKPKPMWEADPTVPPLPWDIKEAKSERKLRFGVLTNDGFFDPAPACQRALETVVENLRKDGHTVVPVEFDLSQHARLYLSLLGAEGKFRGIIKALEGEYLHPSYNFLYKLTRIPGPLRSILAYAYKMLGMPRMASLIAAGKGRDTYEFWEVVRERDRLQQDFIDYWQALGIDALVTPGLGLAALKHGMATKLNQACSYTFLWNNLHFPAGTVPVTYVKENEQEYTSKYRDMLTTDAKEDTKGSAGLPIGVQVVTLPFRDELCIKAMRDVERVSGFKKPLLSRTSPLLKAPSDC